MLLFLLGNLTPGPLPPRARENTTFEHPLSGPGGQPHVPMRLMLAPAVRETIPSAETKRGIESKGKGSSNSPSQYTNESKALQ